MQYEMSGSGLVFPHLPSALQCDFYGIPTHTQNPCMLMGLSNLERAGWCDDVMALWDQIFAPYVIFCGPAGIHII